MAEHNNLKKAVQQIMLGTVTGKHEQTLKVLNRIKASGIVITGMYGFDYSEKKEIDNLIMRLNKAGKTQKLD